MEVDEAQAEASCQGTRYTVAGGETLFDQPLSEGAHSCACAYGLGLLGIDQPRLLDDVCDELGEPLTANAGRSGLAPDFVSSPAATVRRSAVSFNSITRTR